MTDFPSLTSREAAARLLAIERPLILSHARPDGDTLGSAAALALFFRRMGREVRFLVADPIPRRLSFLFAGVDAPPPTEEEMALFTPISVDVSAPAQFGRLWEQFEGRIALMLDHHASGQPFAPHFIRPTAAANGELMADLFYEMAEDGLCPPPDADIAMRLYAAISSDTGCFRHANATPATHRTAARLLECGVRADLVNHALFECHPPEQIAAERIAAAHLSFALGGRIAYIPLTRAARENLADEFFETAVDIARSAEGVELAIFLRETGDGEFRASLRSVDADVASVASSFGGVGHRRAAGCTIYAADIETATDMLLERAKMAL